MNTSINIDEIRRYNASLKEYKEKANKLNAEIEFTNKEIDNICAELSQELGIEVNRDNIKQIYEEQVEKLQSTLKSGETILNKIASDEQASSIDINSIGNDNSNMFSQPINMGQQAQTPVAPPDMQYQAPIQTVQQTPQAPIFSGSAELPANGYSAPLFNI